MPRKAKANSAAADTNSVVAEETNSVQAEEPTVVEEAIPCPVCLESYTAVLRKAIACPSCQAETCVKCLQRYTVETTDDPHCLHCKHGFDRMFLQRTFSKVFMKTTFAEHRAKLLWAREESYLPAAQIKAERITRGYKMTREVIDPLYKQIVALNKERENIYEIIHQQELERQRLLRGEQTRAELVAAGGVVEDDEVKARKQFTRKCTSEDCLGWLSSAWKCGLCDNYTCKDCYVIKGKIHDADHECKKEDLETAELIRNSCKPCPKCGQAIEKQEGCDMMFCTSCHTPFSWKTLQIITKGNIHNPHYFEWRNRVGANAAGAAHAAEPLPCGGMPNDNFIYVKNFAKQYVFDADMRAELSNRFRITTHIELVEAPYYSSHTNIQNTEQYRIKYLLKEMNKEEIENKLQVEENRRERDKAIRDVLDTYLVAAAEQFRIVANEPTVENAQTLICEIDCLRDFINETMHNVRKAYACTVPIILEDWSIVEHLSTQKLRKQEREDAILNASQEYVALRDTYKQQTMQHRQDRHQFANERDAFRQRHGVYAHLPNEFRNREYVLSRKDTDLFDMHQKLRLLRQQLLNPAPAAEATLVNIPHI